MSDTNPFQGCRSYSGPSPYLSDEDIMFEYSTQRMVPLDRRSILLPKVVWTMLDRLELNLESLIVEAYKNKERP